MATLWLSPRCASLAHALRRSALCASAVRVAAAVPAAAAGSRTRSSPTRRRPQPYPPPQQPYPQPQPRSPTRSQPAALPAAAAVPRRPQPYPAPQQPYPRSPYPRRTGARSRCRRRTRSPRRCSQPPMPPPSRFRSPGEMAYLYGVGFAYGVGTGIWIDALAQGERPGHRVHRAAAPRRRGPHRRLRLGLQPGVRPRRPVVDRHGPAPRRRRGHRPSAACSGS